MNVLSVEWELKQTPHNQDVHFVNLVIIQMDLVNVNHVLLEAFPRIMELKHAFDVDVDINPMPNALNV